MDDQTAYMNSALYMTQQFRQYTLVSQSNFCYLPKARKLITPHETQLGLEFIQDLRNYSTCL